MNATILTRAERADILHRCLTNWLLIKRAYRYRALLDLPIKDLLDELGVKIYQALFYYRFKARLTAPGVPPEEQAYKLAITVGHNALGSMVRDAIKRGHINLQPIDWCREDRPAGAWPGLRGPGSATAIATVLDTMTAVAQELVGDQAAGHLLRATVYDWGSRQRLLPAQAAIMHGLKCQNPLQVRRLIETYHERIRAQLPPTALPLTKSEGVWRETRQILS